MAMNETSTVIFFSFSCLFLGSCAGAQDTPRPVTSFEDCVAASHRVLRTYPARCIAPDGRVFVDSKNAPKMGERLCVDRCGDGECAEIVCLGSGCPCPESPSTCPKDCH